MGRRRRKTKTAASRPARERPERQQDPRLVATQVRAIGGEPAPPGTWAVAVSPVRMEDGRMLNWHPPQPVAFNLVEAKWRCNNAVPRRRAIMGNLVSRPNGAYQPQNARAALDCLSDLSAAVLFAFTAVESLANHSIDQLDDEASITIERRKGEQFEIPKAEMVRRLNITEKFTLAVPMLPDGEEFKGTKPWERFVDLKRLRDALVHVKERGYDADPDEHTAYDALMLGAADECADDALAVVLAARPGFLPEQVLAEFE
jgi:hypothetical protein